MEKELTKKDLSDDLVGLMVVVVDVKSRHYRTAGKVTLVDGEYVCFETDHLTLRMHYLVLDRVDDKSVTVSSDGHVCLKTQWVKFKDEQPPKGEPILAKLDGEDVYNVLMFGRFPNPSRFFSHWHLITAPE